MEQLCYWCSQVRLVLRDVLKSATERIVVTNRRVIDTQRRVEEQRQPQGPLSFLAYQSWYQAVTRDSFRFQLDKDGGGASRDARVDG
jgi:hypothetical protein